MNPRSILSNFWGSLQLPLCKRHAVSLGGDIVYDKSYEGGCRFIFELPIDK